MSDAAQELITELTKRIQEMDAEAWADCKRYKEEYDERCQRRRECFHAETADMRRQIDHMIGLLAKAEMLKPMPPVLFPTTQVK